MDKESCCGILSLRMTICKWPTCSLPSSPVKTTLSEKVFAYSLPGLGLLLTTSPPSQCCHLVLALAGPSPGVPHMAPSPCPGCAGPTSPSSHSSPPTVFFKVANLQPILHFLSLVSSQVLALDFGQKIRETQTEPVFSADSWFMVFANTLPLPWVSSHTADLSQGLTETPSPKPQPGSPLPEPARIISVSSTICPPHSLS